MGVQPICRVLTEHGCKIAPSTYYAFTTRAPAARSVCDEASLVQARRVCAACGNRYGADKVGCQLHNATLNGLLADAELGKAALKEVARPNCRPRSDAGLP